jgi:hypothetical protein
MSPISSPLALSVRVGRSVVLGLVLGGAAWAAAIAILPVDHPVLSRVGHFFGASLSGARQGIARSSLVRWWNCRGRDEPILRERLRHGETEGFTISVSRQGGHWGSQLFLEVHGTGEASAVLKNRGQASRPPMNVTLPPGRIRALQLALLESDFFCLSTEDRAGYVVGLGTQKIALDFGGHRRVVFVDDEHAVNDPQAFYNLMSAFYGLKDVFGTELDSGLSGLVVVQP